MAANAGVANSLGLPWPRPLKTRVGRRPRRDLYVDSVYRLLCPQNLDLSCLFGGYVACALCAQRLMLQKPTAKSLKRRWALKRREVTESPPKRKNVEPHPDVNALFTVYAEKQRRLHGWSTAASWRTACELAPEVFGGCNDQIFLWWRAVPLAETNGRHAVLSTQSLRSLQVRPSC